MLTSLLRVIAGILLALFVLALPFSLLMRSVGALAFDPETTKDLVRENLLNSDTMANIARQATEQMLIADGGEAGIDTVIITEALQNLSEEDWNDITDLAAPEELIEGTVNQVVDAYTEWLNGAGAFPDLQLDIEAWKENTAANAGEILAVVLDAQPECDLAAVAGLAMQTLQSGGSFSQLVPVCKPPEPIYSAIISNADTLLAGTLQVAPDVISLNSVTDNVQPPEQLVQLKAGLVQTRTTLNWAWAGVAVIGLLAVAMAARSFRQVLLWAGWPLLLAGGVGLLLGLSLVLFSLRFLDEMLANMIGGASDATALLGSALAGGALDLVSRPMLLQGLLVAAAGGAMLIYARILRQRELSPGVPIFKRKIRL
jgi:hypothetical protein